MKVLLIGFGNPGRLDDGLGPALAERLEKANLPGLTVDANYQLTVEDADAVSKHDVVIFVDASVNGPEPFSFYKIQPQTEDMSFSTHSIEPESVLGMAHEMFDAKTKGYVLGIRGYEFNEFGQELSSDATINLELAIKFILSTIQKQNFDEVLTNIPSNPKAR